MDSLLQSLRAEHKDTWPIKIGFGDLINPDGAEAANEIEQLQELSIARGEQVKRLCAEIERLRKALRLMPKTITDAADEIERLREEVDELKDLIQATVDYTGASVSSNRFTFHASKRFVSLKEKE